MMSTTRGNVGFTMVEMMRDTIQTHGLAWAMQYYAARLPAWELRVFMRAAFLQGV